MPFNPQLIRDRLIQFAQHSLQHLTICHECAYKDTALSLGSLKGFEKLETVAVGSDMFNGTDQDERANKISTHSPYEFLHILPSTIQRITIFGPSVDQRRIVDAIEGITSKKLTFLQLTYIEFQTAHYWAYTHSSEMLSTQKETLKDVGISLVIKRYLAI